MYPVCMAKESLFYPTAAHISLACRSLYSSCTCVVSRDQFTYPPTGIVVSCTFRALGNILPTATEKSHVVVQVLTIVGQIMY